MFDTLSKTQKKIVFEKKGKFVVRACPGSGKTYSVAARLVHNISNWKLRHQGIAAISFTNAAWQEIERQIIRYFNGQRPIPYPHFLGTIDSFINQHIFLPFGHLVMGCKTRPTLIGEPHGIWTGRYFAETIFDNLSYDINGNLYIIRKGIVRSDLIENEKIVSTKNRLIKEGYANQNDANYFGMKVLDLYPNVSKAIIHRFPMLLVDEAQDTSEIQMKILDNLIENGLKQVILVGDPDQAIFEWHAAKPLLFIKKMKEWSDNSIVLNENRRSSQVICNFTCRLSSLDETSKAVNKDIKDYAFLPRVLTYDPENINNLLKKFKAICIDNDIEINPDNIAIIYRSKSIFNLITGVRKITSKQLPWHNSDLFCKDFAKGKYLFDNGSFKEGFKIIQKSIVKKKINSKFCSSNDIETLVEKYGFIRLRKYIFEVINLLPETSCTIGEWLDNANKSLKDNNLNLEFIIKKTNRNMSFDEIFGVSNKKIIKNGFRLGTIHSIKGETFEAVLVILKKKGIGKFYKTLLKENTKIENNEELRIIYVGITRPRKLLILAVPDADNKSAWESKLLN